MKQEPSSLSACAWALALIGCDKKGDAVTTASSSPCIAWCTIGARDRERKGDADILRAYAAAGILSENEFKKKEFVQGAADEVKRRP